MDVRGSIKTCQVDGTDFSLVWIHSGFFVFCIVPLLDHKSLLDLVKSLGFPRDEFLDVINWVVDVLSHSHRSIHVHLMRPS